MLLEHYFHGPGWAYRLERYWHASILFMLCILCILFTQPRFSSQVASVK
jgi:hypothetical protein